MVGGGIVGCSLLYHLAALGWQEVVLLEKAELAGGSTWLAAGNVDRFDLKPNLIRLRDDSIRLYERLAERPERAFAYHRTGGIMLATSEPRLDDLRRRAGLGKRLGMPHLLLSRREILDHYPLMDPTGVIGGLYDPLAGHVDPHNLTQALARAARGLGAEGHEQTALLDMSRGDDGSWLVITDQGEITADVVVNAAGSSAPELAAMIGLELPIMAIEHRYLGTAPISELTGRDGVLPFLCEPDSAFYLRAENDGLIFGAFESEPNRWPRGHRGKVKSVTDVERLPPELIPYLDKAGKRVPCLSRATFKAPVRGPIAMTPDGRPLLGPLPGFGNYFVACGFLNGLSLAGGAGKALAEWIIEGEPPLDLFAFDIARFGAFAGKSYTENTAHAIYSRHFAISFPNDRPVAGRPLKRTAIHDKLATHGGQFDAHYGWERPCWFAAKASERQPIRSFGRTAGHNAIKRECLAARHAVGVADLTASLAKHVFEGPDADAVLDQALASHLPASIGAVRDGLMLNRKGLIAGSFTVARLSEEGFYLLGPAAYERFHQRFFEQCLPPEGVLYAPVSVRYGILAVIGPNARFLLARVANEDVSDRALPDRETIEIEVAGSPAQVMRYSLTGDLSYTLHVPMEYMATVYEALFIAGQDLGLRDIGMAAIDALRLEAGHDRLAGDMFRDLSPLEAGRKHLVGREKGDFIGQRAFLTQEEQGVTRRCVLATVDHDGKDAAGGEPVYFGNEMIGVAIAGGFGHHVGQSLAQVLVPIGYTQGGTRLAIDILGERRAATVLDDAPFEPKNQPLSI